MMKFDDKKFLGGQIKYYRKKAGLTQEALAEKTNLSPQHISRIECGCYVPSLSSFFEIVSILNIDLRQFGFDIDKADNPIKNKLIQKIASASDTKLVFFENLLDATEKSLDKVKRNIL